ncbi:hypothetical protein ACU639_04265 [Streptomyces cynarae]|uniref:hypothetical protein n=1 Tax=Streptomyces cynarae TaxID=2981134 RepID=UPI00406CC67A
MKSQLSGIERHEDLMGVPPHLQRARRGRRASARPRVAHQALIRDASPHNPAD